MGFAWVNGGGCYDVLLADLPQLPGPASAVGPRHGRPTGSATAGRRGRHAVRSKGLRAAVMAGQRAHEPAKLVTR
jgi:hypothetical protein